MSATPQHGLHRLLSLAPVIPVLTFEAVEEAVRTAKALVAGGLPVLEITLRTPCAIDCLKAIAAEVEGAICGVGTAVYPRQISEAARAGATFAVSPGISPRLLDAAATEGLPLLPGLATVSEAIALLERGYGFAKFFPAESAGGTSWLGSIASPIPQIKFCPTGGISLDNAPRYLALPNVICVGGSWVASRRRIEAADWDGIREAARVAAELRGPSR